jgi:hypothetical protein
MAGPPICRATLSGSKPGDIWKAWSNPMEDMAAMIHTQPSADKVPHERA